MLERQFFESSPLYRQTYFQERTLAELKACIPSIRMNCEICGDVQTFRLARRNPTEPFSRKFVTSKTSDQIMRIDFECAGCGDFYITFLLYFSSADSVMKVGQYPPWSIEPDNHIKKALGEYLPLFKKGLICESQGYGIAAYAYYRRIVEELIDDMLAKIADLFVTEEARAPYVVALEKVRESRVADEKIGYVKDLLPDALRPSGHNPIGTLHDVLSVGLHRESDEECLECATAIRAVLGLVLERIAVIKKTDDEYRTTLEQLQERVRRRSIKRTTKDREDLAEDN